jgi:hypothetical protein
MRLTYPGPPSEADTVSGIFDSQRWGDPLSGYQEIPNTFGRNAWDIAEQATPFGETLLLACQQAEDRLQQIKPMPPGYYFDHRKKFVNEFITRPDISVGNTEHVLLVGQEGTFDQVLPLILARRENIVEVTGKEPQKFVVFMGDGETMEHRYRSIGSSKPPYSYAILGALDCYLNTDHFVDGRIENNAMLRAIWHEPAHVMWNLILGRDLTRSDMLLHEVLGGPLDPELWADIEAPIRHLDSIPLLQGEVAFWDWYKQTAAENGYTQPYFENPLTRQIILRVQHVGYAELYRIAKERRSIERDNFSQIL